MGSTNLEPFFVESKEIKKGEGYFSPNEEMLKELEKISESNTSKKKALSLKKLLEQNIDVKEEYIKNKREEDKIQKATAQSQLVAWELGNQNMKDKKKT